LRGAQDRERTRPGSRDLPGRALATPATGVLTMTDLQTITPQISSNGMAIETPPNFELRDGNVLVTMKTKNGDIALYTMSVPMLVKSINAGVKLLNDNLAIAPRSLT
jgi:hypothetical protein